METMERSISMNADGGRGKSRPWKTRQEVLREDLRLLELNRKSAQDNTVWRTAIKGTQSDPFQQGK